MLQALIVSNVVLWVAVVALAGVVLALMRQIGVLHERVAPAGALMNTAGPSVGEAAPVFETEDWSGVRHRIGGVAGDGKSTLVLFVSPTCPVCKTMLSIAESLWRRERRELRLLLASDGPRSEHEGFALEHHGEDHPYLLSSDIGLAYQVSKLPYAVLIDAAGVLRGKGLVNTREHLESLFEARARGVASLQDYIRRTGVQR